MKNEIYKHAVALVITNIIVILLYAGYRAMCYIIKESSSPISFATLLGLFAIYMYYYDYIDRKWK